MKHEQIWSVEACPVKWVRPILWSCCLILRMNVFQFQMQFKVSYYQTWLTESFYVNAINSSKRLKSIQQILQDDNDEDIFFLFLLYFRKKGFIYFFTFNKQIPIILYKRVLIHLYSRVFKERAINETQNNIKINNEKRSEKNKKGKKPLKKK